MLLVVLFPFLSILSQPLAVVPRAGEGRNPRSSEAALWVNPVFVQPSVFFSDREFDLRWRRAWWRAEIRAVQPVDWESVEIASDVTHLPSTQPDSLQRLPFLFPRLHPIRSGAGLPDALIDGVLPTAPRTIPLKGSDLLNR